ncbi:NFX1-type zinc finger-containing protein 1-like protein, partial [Dinothrombium tinctorium]
IFDLILKLKDYKNEFLEKRLHCLLRFLIDSFENNEQQLDDISKEIQVLSLFEQIAMFRKKHSLNDNTTQLLNKAEAIICKYNTVSEEDIAQFKSLLNEASKMITGLGISFEEKQMILKAMNFGQRGHWYKCPNGHIYCITECGGAMQQSICPECSEEIGGGSHRLLSSNSVATEMDGASIGAFDQNVQAWNANQGI